ncbi:hypothetical protein AQ946_23585 [Burkholderia pseudomallei]|uniref:hypothetical protein n=1 Tax=Burkholderia pseudomallei TaxID=28450 RepID=UPI00097802F4|nr:hypothetical protein [Burkholderia pseudomallei]ONE22460.1 hypothetical protein AQ946_23585 [Burkholderia pseudomallei]ONE31421.1 hypothetical protein AQ948_25135 [Burkholderia pseudomallei]ONE37942.1 hypothetical protein AQ947_16185 [Burkholderia pseudomallei]CAJ6699315.1 Uncharacterised protein [Burkholderia pseudomallei]CAJ7882243.1 Uncharacterised protein [Burkholderia pseudomallei]
MFNVQDTLAKITSCTNRSEKHGKEREPAISIGLTLVGGGELLDQFDAALRPMLYRKPQPKPGELPMEHAGLTELRFPQLRNMRWDKSYSGHLLRFHIGASGAEDVLLPECEIKEISFVTMDGGSVEVSFKVNAHPKDDEDHGKIARRVQQEIGITLTPPDNYVEPGLFGDAPAADDEHRPFAGSDLDTQPEEETEED